MHRFRRFGQLGSAAVLLFAAGCASDPGASEPEDPIGTPTPDVTEPTGDCDDGGVFWSDRCVTPRGTGDNLAFVGTFDGSSFNEPVEVLHVNDYVLYCAGTKGLSVYHTPPGEPPSFIVHSGQLGSNAHPQFPRCQHLAFGTLPANIASETFDVFVTNRGDETQPAPWIKWVRFDGGVDVITPQWQSIDLNVISTLPGAADTASYEGIVVHNGLLYAAVHHSGIQVIDTDKDTLRVIATVPLSANAFDVVISDAGDLLVATSDGGVIVMDLTDPRSPTIKGQADSVGTPTRLATAGDYAYVATGAAGLEIFDISDPTAPARIDVLDTPGTAMDVNVDGNHAVVASWTDLRVFDITDPTNAFLLAAETVPSGDSFSRVLSADITGNQVFAGEWTALLAYELDPSSTPADIRVDRDELIFASPGVVRDLTVRNEGWHPLVVEASVSAGYSVSDSVLTIPPGEVALLTVTATDAMRGRLDLATNEPDEPLVQVQLLDGANGPGIGVGDKIPDDWTFVDIATGEPRSFATLADGQVALLAYFSTF